MSRRGLLPQAHRAVTALNLDPADICFGASLVTLWRFVRRLAKETMAAGGDWRSVVDGIRPYTWELWRRLPFELEATLPAPRARLLGGASPPHGA